MKNLQFSRQVLVLIIGTFVFSACDRSNNDKVEPVNSKIAKTTILYSNLTLEKGKSNTKYYSEEIGNAVAGQKVKVLELGGWEKFKVELPDGTMGWLDAEYLEPEKNTFVKFNVSEPNKHIASNRGAIGSARKIVKEVNEKTAVTRLEEYREVKSSGYIIDWTKVRSEDGIEGWIMSDYLFRVVMEPVRYINRKEWHYTMEGFIKKWKDEPIEKLIKRYKEPSAVKVTENEKIYFFNNIYLLKDHRNRIGIRVHTEGGKVKDVDSGIYKTNWVSYMPLSNVAKINFLSNYIGNWQYIAEKETDINKKSWSFWDYFPGWLSWIIIIIILIIMLAILYAILWFPYFLMNKWIFKQSQNRKLFNKRVKLYAILTSIIIGYTYYLLMTVNFYPFNNFFFVTTLLCLGMILGNIYRWRNRLDYNRCDSPECHQWTGQDNGTEFLGGTTETQTIRNNSTGATEKNTRTTRHYRDHRICTACGYRWSIRRTEVIGGLKV